MDKDPTQICRGEHFLSKLTGFIFNAVAEELMEGM